MQRQQQLIDIPAKLKYHTKMILCIGILVLCSASGWAGRVPTPVTINKCCRIGERLDRSQQCMIGSTEKWVPYVYLIARKEQFMPAGEAPRFFKIREESRPDVCDDPDLILGPHSTSIFSNGSLFLVETHQLINSPEDYCVDKDAALVCFPKPKGADSLTAPMKLSKIKKCCGHKSAYDRQKATCISLNQDHPVSKKNIINSTRTDVLVGFPVCQNYHRYTIVGDFEPQHWNEETGTLTGESGKQFLWNDFCVDHIVDSDKESSSVNVFACADNYSDPESVPVYNQDIRFVLYSIGLLISVIFLSATLATGFLLPSNHHVLHWRCQTYYVCCLLVGDLLLAITQIFGNSIAGPTCISMAIGMHFFFLAAFFWLNTMCFNIWWTFRDFRPTTLEKSQELVRLRIYQVYAWGVPLVIAGVAAILDHLPKGADETFLRPRFGEKKCWFFGNMEIFTYFFGPIGILLVINCILFASTARQLTCGLWKRDDVKSTTERAALGRVCLKLVVVMGVTWMADVISWIVGGPHYLWYVTDLINALQGVFIFIVVGCQPQVWAAIRRMWGSKSGRSVMNTTHGPQHSSSSHGLPSIGESMTNNTTSSKIPMETVC